VVLPEQIVVNNYVVVNRNGEDERWVLAVLLNDALSLLEVFGLDLANLGEEFLVELGVGVPLVAGLDKLLAVDDDLVVLVHHDSCAVGVPVAVLGGHEGEGVCGFDTRLHLLVGGEVRNLRNCI